MIKERKHEIYQSNTDSTPEAEGFDSNQLELLDDLYQELIEKEMIQAGAYVLAKNGKMIAHRSMGKLRLTEDKGDFKTDSIRRIASITKVFTTTAIMQLVEKGKLILEQPVSMYIKEFDTTIHRDISIFQLITHTSGLMGDSGSFLEPYPSGWWDIDKTSPYNWIQRIISGPLAHERGQVWSYCSGGFCILGEIVTRVSGMVFEDYVVKNILEPIGMTRSFFCVPKELHDEVCLTFKGNLDYKRDLENDPPPAGGGLYSTVEDLYKFGQMMLNSGTYNGNRILGRKTVEFMTRNQLYNVPAYNWNNKVKNKQQGIGWGLNSQPMISEGTFNHDGAGCCGLYIDPKEQFIASFFVAGPLHWCGEGVVGTIGIVWAGIL